MESVINVRGVLVVNTEDGSIKRTEPSEHMSVPEDPEGRDGVVCKDVNIQEDLGLWARVYIPTSVIKEAEDGGRVPVVVYFHGGGFCFHNPSLRYFDSLCRSVAKEAGSIVVSVNYRLAPEHRLPSAYDDAASALQWMLSVFQGNEGAETRSPGESWLGRYGDMSKVFLMGDSAGGNIVHHVIARATNGAHTWKPMNIRGLVLLQPFFGGEQRTESERVLGVNDKMFLTLKTSDDMRRLALPEGANRDHPFCNIWAEGDVGGVFVKKCFPSALVVIGGKDMLKDRGLRYTEDLRRSGRNVEVVVYEEEQHAFTISTNAPLKTSLILLLIFLYSSALLLPSKSESCLEPRKCPFFNFRKKKNYLPCLLF